MCNINLTKLSPRLYQEAVKAAKENKVNNKMNDLINLASEKGFTKEEKSFLEGLASDDNIQKLKSSKAEPKSIIFEEPGFKFGEKQKPTKQQPESMGLMDDLKKSFNDYVAEPFKKLEKGTSENIKQVSIRNKIDSFETLGKAMLDKLNAKLPNKNDQANFVNLYKKLDETSKTGLIELLDSKKIHLDSKDSKGISLISNLYNLSGVKNKNIKFSDSDDLEKPSLVKDAISMLKDDKNVLQGYHGTCGAASMENYLRDSYPSELVRIVTELSSKGKCTLADGKDNLALKVARGSMQYDESDRNSFDRIFQSSVMQNVAEVGGDERSTFLKDISNAIPEAEYDVVNDDGSPNAVARGDSAADPYLMTNLLNRLMKGKETYNTKSNYNVVNLIGIDAAALKLKSSIAKGDECIACYKYEGSITGSRHYVTVTGIEKDPSDNKDYVYFKNTADPSDNKMELSEFTKKLEFTIGKKK